MIICVGEILADLIGREHDGIFSYDRFAGGAPFNVACGLKKLGALSVLWNLFDFFFGVCAVCNLVVCFLMRKQIGALINDYLTRLKSGKWEPTSEAAANAIPELWVNDKAAK